MANPSSHSNSLINKSGNSNVSVYVDNTPVAYALIYCLYACDKLNDSEMKTALDKIESLKGSPSSKSTQGLPDPSELDLTPPSVESPKRRQTLSRDEYRSSQVKLFYR